MNTKRITSLTRNAVLGGVLIPAMMANQLGGVPFTLTPDRLTVTGTPTQLYTGSGSGIGGGVYSTPTFSPIAAPPPLRSTAQTVSNAVTGQLKFEQITALASQALAAFGKNTSTQISGLTVKTVQPSNAYSGYGNAGTPNQSAATYPAYAANNGAGANAVNGVTGIFDGIASSFGVSSTVLLLGAGVGIYLLLKEPPRRSR